MTANACDTTSTDHDEHAAWLLERARHETDPAEAASLREQVLADTHEMATDSAKRFEEQGVDRRDLDQVAMLALVQAIRRHRPEQDGTLRAFAVSLITGDLTRYVRAHGRRLQREPAPPEVARVMGLSHEDVTTTQDAFSDRDGDSVTLVSLCATLGRDSRGRPVRGPRSGSVGATVGERIGIGRPRNPRFLLDVVTRLGAHRGD